VPDTKTIKVIPTTHAPILVTSFINFNNTGKSPACNNIFGPAGRPR
jgi:hypothetical protein